MSDSQRLDKWLFFARFVKTRGLGTEWCEKGRVTLNGQPGVKPAHPVRAGDVLILPKGRDIQAVRVLGLGTRRGPAPHARLLYEILNERT
ncbi:MAG: RNA-binding S4 domain-containing protein [Rhodospirillales bacterium]|jgi:ribosome-associated heat shock protein Hsp15|nr:RNA-binding S4 domain-containing protein [Rhodospirillales bacterium]